MLGLQPQQKKAADLESNSFLITLCIELSQLHYHVAKLGLPSLTFDQKGQGSNPSQEDFCVRNHLRPMWYYHLSFLKKRWLEAGLHKALTNIKDQNRA